MQKLDVAEMRIRNERIRGTTNVGEISKKVQILSSSRLVVWACIEKRRRIRRQESDGDEGAGKKKDKKTKAEVVG